MSALPETRPAAPARPKAPLGCYWRGNVLWAQAKIRGHRHAWTLGTSDPALAAERREARLKGLREPAEVEDAKERLRAGRKLTAGQLAFVMAAIDRALVRGLGAGVGADGQVQP
jgi:hypothetical protein